MKKEIMKLQTRNREINDRLAEIYSKAETEKRELNEEESAEEKKLTRELKQNHREILMSTDAAAIANLRETIDRNKQYREYLQGVRQKREDNTTTLIAKTVADGTSIQESGAITLKIEDIIDTKENGLGLPQGANLVTGVVGDDLYPYSINDVEIEEVGEIEAINEQALKFDNIKVVSQRVALAVSVSNKAIDNAAFDLVSFVLYKIRKAWAIYFAKKIYSHADWNGNKGPFSLVTPGSIKLDATFGETVDTEIAKMSENGFDDNAVIILSPAAEAKLKHTYEGNGVNSKTIIADGLCAGHPYVVTKHVNYTLNGEKEYVKDSGEYVGIGMFNYLALQQHGEVRQTVDAVSAQVAKQNKTVIVFNTEISITELSAKVNGNTTGKPQAFALLKVATA